MLDTILGTPLFFAGAFLLGLLIGSFLNVVIYRLPIMLERSWREECEAFLHPDRAPADRERFDLLWPPSRCPGCKRRVRAIENIPILSYLVLRGRCRGCGTRISPRYPVVEFITGVLFLLVALQFGPTLQALAGFVFVAMLLALAFIDFDHKLLPDLLTIPLLWAGLAISLGDVFVSSPASIIGALVGYLSLWLIFHGFRLVTGKEGLGYGDFKLLAAMGAWMGWVALPLVLLFSSLVGSVLGVALIASRRLERNEALPFGPFLAAGGALAFLWGEAITQAYLSSFGGL